MALAVVVIGFLGILILIGLGIFTGVILGRALGGSTPDEASRLARRRITAIYTIAALLGVAFATTALILLPVLLPWMVAVTQVPGVLAAIGPSLVGLCYAGVATLGEAMWPTPTGTQRGAYLTRRPTLVHASLVPMRAGVTWAALLTTSLTLFGIVAVQDGDGAGTAMPHIVTDPNISGWNGPFPGWAYGVPMLIFAGLLVATTITGLHVIARRPAVAGTTPENDLMLREVSATRLIKGVQLSLALSLAGVLAVAGQAAHSGGWWWGVPCVGLAVVVLISSIVVLGWETR